MRYQTHPNGPPEGLRTAVPADLSLGARLYLSDPRRTPVRVTQHAPQTASFTVTVTEFEDAGARWTFPVWEANRFLAPPNTPQLDPARLNLLMAHAERLNRSVTLETDPVRAQATLHAVSATTETLRMAVRVQTPPLPSDADALLSQDTPCPRWSAFVQTQLDRHGLEPLDAAFAAAYASNPNAGEMVKAHLMTLAEMGLCTYRGPILRDPAALEGMYAEAHRRAHIVLRLALTQVMFERLGLRHLRVYRGLTNAGRRPAQTRFTSTSAHRSVAEALLAPSGGTVHAADSPVSRIFLSYLDTPALSARYREAEVLLLPAPHEAPI